MEFQILYALQELHTPLLNRIMVFITRLGDGGIFWLVLAGVLLLFRKTRKCGLTILVSMAICYLLGNIFLKNVIARPRPSSMDPTVPLLIPTPREYSFPSGHTHHGFTAATAIFLHFKKPGIAALVLAALIAFSRMYLFVHFPTDILGGMILGIGVAVLVYMVIMKRNKNLQKVWLETFVKI